MHDFDDDSDTNPTNNPSLSDLIDQLITRREALKLGSAAAAMGFLSSLGLPKSAFAHSNSRALIGFQSVPLPTSRNPDLVVAAGYTARVLLAWGDPVVAGAPEFAPDASQTSADQERQAGMHHDGIAYFPLLKNFGLLAINHEYADTGLLFTDPLTKDSAVWTAEMARKVLAAHGVSIVAVRRNRRGWRVVREAHLNRRITGYTPMRAVGPAAGSPLLQTDADPTGAHILGTLNNCGGAATPWGTYVTGEENYDFYFAQPIAADLTPEERRYMQSALSGLIRVHRGDPRFDMLVPGNRNEPNRFGWMVEIDPYHPESTPLKLTGLGRFKHEMAAVRLTEDKRAVSYSGDDERNNYLYKFVGSRTVKEARRARKSPLEDGTLYVAKFDAGDVSGDGRGTGQWIPLTPENPVLAGWSMDRILVFTRLAADAVGATRMDRPEWISVAPDNQVYVCCTNNSRRGRATTNPTEGTGGLPENFTAPIDEANPRGGSAGNPFGQIVRWKEDGDADALTFTWDIFVLAGDPANPLGLPGGNTVGDIFASPDAITVDHDGRVWVGTDMFSSELSGGAYTNFHNNMLLAADPESREFRRFLTGPSGCEVTGITFSPDRRAMFLDIQHPGEPPEVFTNNLSNPSTRWPWPDPGTPGDVTTRRPRSATVVITKDDGGVIGT